MVAPLREQFHKYHHTRALTLEKNIIAVITQDGKVWKGWQFGKVN